MKEFRVRSCWATNILRRQAKSATPRWGDGYWKVGELIVEEELCSNWPRAKLGGIGSNKACSEEFENLGIRLEGWKECKPNASLRV